MAQFRLTNQFAKDLQVIVKQSPAVVAHPLDDWVGDVFRVSRKKVALFTHVETLISFVFPYSEVGGAKNVLECLPIDLEAYLRDNDLEEHVDSMVEIFNQPPVFTKTENQKVLGHMNDFRKFVLYASNRERVNWHEISNELKEDIVRVQGSIYKTPQELLENSLTNCITIG